jgi:hypothetical protein
LSKITAAVDSKNITADALAELIAEAQFTLTQANEAAKAERARALDPTRSTDPVQAKQAMEAAAFARDRLHNILPRLAQRQQEVSAQELYDAWAQTFDRRAPRHTTAAAKLREVYTEFRTS